MNLKNATCEFWNVLNDTWLLNVFWVYLTIAYSRGEKLLLVIAIISEDWEMNWEREREREGERESKERERESEWERERDGEREKEKEWEDSWQEGGIKLWKFLV